MSKWVLDEWDERLDYPTLGFTADPGDILDATAAPDGRWSLNGDQGAAETVTRYTIGGDPSYVEPGANHILAWSDDDNTYVPQAPETLLATDEWADTLSASYVAHVPPATGNAINDTVNVLAARSRAVAAGTASSVVFAGGTYLLTSPLLLSGDEPFNVDGGGKTILKMAPGANLDAVLDTEGWDDLTGSGSSDGIHHISISRLIVDGNKAENASGVAGRLYGWAYSVTDVLFVHGSEGGLLTEWGADRAPVTSPPQYDVDMGAVFTGVRALSNDGDGWRHHGPHDSTFVGCSTAFNTGQGWTDDVSIQPTGANGAGSHVLNFNSYSNGGRAFYTNNGGLVGHDIATSGPGPSLLIGQQSGACRLTGLTAQSIEVRSTYHQIEGLITNGYEDSSYGPGLRIGNGSVGSFGCKYDLIITNCRNGIHFANDAGGNFIRATIIPYDGTSTVTTGTKSASTTTLIRNDGVGPTPASTWEMPGTFRAALALYTGGNVYAAHNTAGQCHLGSAGPGGQAGVDLQGEKIWRASSANLETASSFRAQGHLLTANNVYAAHNTGTQSLFGSAGPGGQMGLQLVSDVNLYRDAANVLRTDDKFVTTGLAMAYVAKTAAYTLTATDYTVNADATGGAFNVTLPTAVGRAGQVYVVRKSDASANAVTVNTTSSQTINGATTYGLTAQYQTVRVQSDGANWMVV